MNVDITERNASSTRLRDRNRQLDLLGRTSQRLLLAEDLEKELQTIFSDIADHMGVESYFFYRLAGPRLLKLQMTAGVAEDDRLYFSTMKFGDLLCGRVAETQVKLVIEDLQQCVQPGAEVLRSAGAKSYAGFPLVANGKLMGTIAFVSHERTHFRDGDIRTVQTICDQVAITLERWRLQRELTESEERLRLALEGADLGYWDINLQTGATVWNRRQFEIEGLDPEIGVASIESWRERIHPLDLKAVEDNVDRACREGANFSVEHRLCPDAAGNVRWLGWYGRFFYDDVGKPVRLAGISRDITEYKSAEDRLRRSEERLRFVADRAQIGHWVWEISTDRLEWSALGKQLFGIPPEEPISYARFLAALHPDDRERTDRAVRACLESGGLTHYDIEYRTLWPDGTVKWIYARGDAEFADGRPERMAGIVIDITARKKAEARLRESEERLRLAVAISGLGLISIDYIKDTGVLNPTAAILFGLPPSVAVARTDIHARFHPDDRAEIFERISKCFDPAGSGSFEMIHRVIDADGSTHWLNVRKQVTFGEISGVIRPVTALLATVDVTESMQAEEALRESERRKSYLLRLSDKLRSLADPAAIQAAAARVLGEELNVARVVFYEIYQGDCITTAEYSRGVPSLAGSCPVASVGRELLERESRGEAIVVSDVARAHSKSEAQRFEEIEVGAYIGVPSVRHGLLVAGMTVHSRTPRDWTATEVGMTQDAAERTWAAVQQARAEILLRESESRFRQVAETLPQLVWTCSSDGRCDYLSPQWVRYTGKEESEQLGFGWAEQLHPDDRERVVARWRATAANPKSFDVEFRIRRYDGAYRWFRTLAVPLRDEAGSVVKWFGSNTDIHERKQDEAAKARLAAIIASSSEAIFSSTIDGVVTSWNEAAERMFGYSAQDMIGSPGRRIVPPDLQAEEDDILARTRRGEPVENYETVRISKQGRAIDVFATISPILDETGEIVGASHIAHDITEKKRAEERERLLMREINHRSKNMLALVQSIARQTATIKPHDFLASFEDRVHALAAAQDLLVQHDWKAVPLADLVESQLAHFADLIGGRITCSGPPLWSKPAAAQALGLALHELATNAAKYGALSIATGRVAITWKIETDEVLEPQFTISWVESGGPPVAAPKQHGFGSTVTTTMIKMSLRGEVVVDYCEPGLVWRVECPANRIAEDIRPEFLEARSVQPAMQASREGAGRVLVLEDEPIVAAEIASVLHAAGFDVIGPACSVEDALALIETVGCDAAVLDVCLEDCSSEPVARRLMNAGTPFLVVSGYSRAQLPEVFQAAPLISKPIPAAVLKSEISRCLGVTENAHNESAPSV